MRHVKHIRENMNDQTKQQRIMTVTKIFKLRQVLQQILDQQTIIE